VFINATNGQDSLAALRAVSDALNGKVVIDTSNALDFSQGFPPSLFVSNTDSLAKQLQRALPEARLVKMFNTMNNQVMGNPRGLSDDSTIFVAGNDVTARQHAAAWPPTWAGPTYSTWAISPQPAASRCAFRCGCGCLLSSVALSSTSRSCADSVPLSVDQERVTADSSEADSSPAADPYSIDCSSVGGLVLRMKNAQTRAAMLITAATPNAV
jgi:hypothetical protein